MQLQQLAFCPEGLRGHAAHISVNSTSTVCSNGAVIQIIFLGQNYFSRQSSQKLAFTKSNQIYCLLSEILQHNILTLTYYCSKVGQYDLNNNNDNNCIQHGYIKVIKSNRKNIFINVQKKLFQINAVLLNLCDTEEYNIDC